MFEQKLESWISACVGPPKCNALSFGPTIYPITVQCCLSRVLQLLYSDLCWHFKGDLWTHLPRCCHHAFGLSSEQNFTYSWFCLTGALFTEHIPAITVSRRLVMVSFIVSKKPLSSGKWKWKKSEQRQTRHRAPKRKTEMTEFTVATAGVHTAHNWRNTKGSKNL